MPNYQKMYAILCGSISDALDLLPNTAENQKAIALLQQALDTTEEIYIAEADSSPDSPNA